MELPPSREVFHEEIVKVASLGGPEALADLMARQFSAEFYIHTEWVNGGLKLCLHVARDQGGYQGDSFLEVLTFALVGEYERMHIEEEDHDADAA